MNKLIKSGAKSGLNFACSTSSEDFGLMIDGRRLFGRRIFVGRRTIAVALSVALVSIPYNRAAAVTVGGPFTLTAPDGHTVTDQSFMGRWLLVYFGYTSCPDSCPTALADIAKTLNQLGSDSERVQPVFITLDPSRDTRQVIGDYVKSFDPRIVGLTGTQDQIDAVMRAYGAYAMPHLSEPTRSDVSLDHSVYIYLIGPHGDFIRAFDPSWTPERMADAVRRAIAASDHSEKHGELAEPTATAALPSP